MSSVARARVAVSALGVSLALVACGPPMPPLPAKGAGSPPAAASGAPSGPAHEASGDHHGHSDHGEHHGHGGAGGHHEQASAGHQHSAPTANHRFDDPERWAKVFDDPKRDEWQRPDDVVRELGLGPSDVVADLGAGTGYFAVRLARAVPKGKVLAIDIEEKLVAYMKQRAEREGTKNLEPLLATADDPKLPDGVHVVLVVDTYHHIGDRSAYFGRVRKSLASGGRVVVVDFKKGDLPVGPPDSHKLAPDVVTTEMKAAGYAACRSYDGLPYQYLLVFAEKC